MARPVTAAIALGSNTGDRAAHLHAALAALASLPSSRLLRASGFLQTAPVAVGQADPGGPFLNAAAIIETSLPPRTLLDELHTIERARGRDRSLPRGSPRPLDLDLLLYGDQVLDLPGLAVPHPRMTERLFVLQPLAEIAPDLPIPPHRRTPAQCLAALAAAPTEHAR